MDRKIIFLDNDKNSRIYSISFKETLKEIIKIHNLSVQMSYIVGKIGIITNIFSSLLLKNLEDELYIYVELNEDNFVKSYISKNGVFKIMIKNPQQTGELEKLFKDYGIIKFVRRLKGYKEDLETVVPKNSSVIEQNFVNYFYDSQNSNILIKTDIKYDFYGNNYDIIEAGGLAVCPYPEVHSNYLNFLYFLSKDKIDLLKNIENNPEKIIQNFFGSIKGQIISEEPVFLKCDCSYNFALNLINIMDKKEIMDYIEKKEKPSIKCLFCNKEYLIEIEDLIKLVNNKNNN